MGAYELAADGTLLAPALFTASIYMTLGRIIASVKGEKYSIVPIQ
jgi:RTA1 like protein